MIILTILIFSTDFSFGQRPRRDFDPSNLPKVGTITGKIVDAETGAGLPSASLYLYAFRDSSLVTGGLTNQDGTFKIDKVRYGKFFMTIKYIGYEKKNVDDILIIPKQRSVDLGEIRIATDAITTGEVEVTAERMQIEYKVDKKIITPNKDITSAGGTAVEVLENVPSVNVDIEGNVSLRGSTNFTVFINGKPSVLDANDALQQIPASTIENIEIITNPSVKYDPDGVAGIININLKEQEESGWSGMTDISAGTFDNYRINGLLNYKMGNFDVFGGVNYGDRNRMAEGNFIQETIQTGGETHLDYNNEMERGYYGLDIKGGITYHLGEMSSVSLEGRYGQMEFSRYFESNIKEWFEDPNLLDYKMNKSLVKRNRDYYAVHFDYIQRFDTPRHKLTAAVYYSDRSGGGDDDQKIFETDPTWDIIDQRPDMTRSTETENSGDLRIKLDYVLPLGENSIFEAGGQFEMEPEEENNIFEEYDPESDSWIIDNIYSSAFDFTDNNSAIYSTYTNQLFGIDYKVGLRGEYTYRVIELMDTSARYSIDRFDFFPSVHLSSKLDQDNQLYASYGRRIRRPWGRSLEPSKVYRDEYNFMIGNPQLEPEYVNSFELGYLYYFGRSMISLETYFRQTVNKITRIKIPQENGLIKNTWENINKDYSTGIELMANLDLADWFNLNASMDFYNYWLEGSLETGTVDNNTFVWGSRLNATFKLTSTTRFQANSFYRAPSIYAQGETSEFWGANIALRQDLFERDLSIVLQFRDVFSTYKHEYTLNQENFYSYHYMSPYSPMITLTFSYKFNNFEKKRRGNGSEGMDSEIDSEF